MMGGNKETWPSYVHVNMNFIVDHMEGIFVFLNHPNSRFWGRGHETLQKLKH